MRWYLPLITVSIVVMSASISANAGEREYPVGAAKLEITPTYPTLLAGYIVCCRIIEGANSDYLHNRFCRGRDSGIPHLATWPQGL